MYTGAANDTNHSVEDSLSSRVVQNLMEPLYLRNHHVYMDNFFSSLDLCKKLAEKGTYMIGTMMVSRRGWPVELKKVQQLSKEMVRGDTRSTMVDDIQCLLWKDNKGVSLVNNIVDPNKRSTVLRSNKDGTRAQIPCPEAICLYNHFMGE
jgi:hypothetical protein